MKEAHGEEALLAEHDAKQRRRRASGGAGEESMHEYEVGVDAQGVGFTGTGTSGGGRRGLKAEPSSVPIPAPSVVPAPGPTAVPAPAPTLGPTVSFAPSAERFYTLYMLDSW